MRQKIFKNPKNICAQAANPNDGSQGWASHNKPKPGEEKTTATPPDYLLSFKNSVASLSNQLQEILLQYEYQNQIVKSSKKVFEDLKGASNLENINLGAFTSGNLEELAAKVSIDNLVDTDEIEEYFSKAVRDFISSYQAKQKYLSSMKNVLDQAANLTVDANSCSQLRNQQNQGSSQKKDDGSVSTVNTRKSENTNSASKAQFQLDANDIDPNTCKLGGNSINNAYIQYKVMLSQLQSENAPDEIEFLKDRRKLDFAATFMQLLKLSIDFSSLKEDLESGPTGEKFTGMQDPNIVFQMADLLKDASKLTLQLVNKIQPATFSISLDDKAKGQKNVEDIKKVLTLGAKRFENKAYQYYKDLVDKNIFFGQSK